MRLVVSLGTEIVTLPPGDVWAKRARISPVRARSRASFVDDGSDLVLLLAYNLEAEGYVVEAPR
jgi:hypothetical protein